MELLTRTQISEMVRKKIQETGGMTGHIPSDHKCLDGVLLTSQQQKTCNNYAWNMFPYGGDEWEVAWFDFACKVYGAKK